MMLPLPSTEDALGRRGAGRGGAGRGGGIVTAGIRVASGAAAKGSFVMQVMQAEAKVTPPQGAPAAIHRHPLRLRRSAVSLLGTSDFARLAIVAGVSAVLWIAIAWALA